jgi:hypothetical protein
MDAPEYVKYIIQIIFLQYGFEGPSIIKNINADREISKA